jgi:DNA-binding response OmpR family regulator
MSRKVDIVLIEDDSGQVELTRRAFRQHNLENVIEVIQDGAAALEFFKRNNARPRLILLDLKLPKVSGIELLRYLKSDAHWRRVPVIILTTSSKDVDMQTCYELGANSYIVKPIAFREFVDAARQIGMYWVLLNKA